MNRFFVVHIVLPVVLAASLAASSALSAQVQPPAGARVTDQGWFPPRKGSVPMPILPDKITRAFVIPIRSPITPTLYGGMKRKVTQCIAKGAQIVIFDMDTPGGRSDAMNDIVRLIMEDLRGIYTVAWVNPEAISAGSVIALACSEIVATPSGRIGDAMPIMIAGGKLVPIPKAERGKIESYMRSHIRTIAQRNGYSEPLCEAMITLTRRVWLIRKIKTRELRLIDPESGNWSGRVAGAPGLDSDDSGKPPQWEFVKIIDRDDELVTFTTKEARQVGLIETVLADMSAVREHYHITTEPVVLADTWSEVLVGWLTSPVVSGLLMTVGILGIIIELRTPGVGLPGAVGVICFAILLGSHYLIGLAAVWEVALFALGVLLVLLEVFVIPGFGVAGISGIICCVVGLLAIFINNPPDKLPIPSGELGWAIFTHGIFALACAFVLAIVLGAIIAKSMPKIPFANRLLLAPVEVSGGSPVADRSLVLSLHAGDLGLVESPCRPVGKVRFGEALVDAVSEGESIEAGARVRILHHDGNRLVVKRQENA